MTKIDLVIFTCEGREHLLSQTIQSFREKVDFNWNKTILAIDGKVDSSVEKIVQPDMTLQHHQQIGYVNSIYEALKVIDSPYFFWLEDDFVFKQVVDVNFLEKTLTENKNWANIALSRTAPISEQEIKQHHFKCFYIPEFGYSVSPALCTTAHLKVAMQDLVKYPKNDKSTFYGFETFFDNYFIRSGLSYAMLNPGEIAHVDHAGILESSDRESHMINAIGRDFKTISKNYISSFGSERKISFWNKFGMFCKLTRTYMMLGFGLFFKRKIYDFVFRVYLNYKKKF